MPNRRASTAIAAIAFRTSLIIALGGCALPSLPATTPARQETIVRVKNNAFADIVVYAVVSRTPWRLGLVNGNSVATLKLPTAATASTGQVQFMARPIGGQAYMIPGVLVGEGDQLELTLGNAPATSYLSVFRR